MVAAGKKLPLTNNVVLDQATVLELIDQLRVSVPDEVRQARRITEELKILMLHGVLHLSGLDHETDRGAMAREEKRWRKRFGLPVGLIERVKV